MLGYRVRKQGFTSRREAETWYMRMRHLISSGQYEKYLDDESKKKEVDNKLSVRKAAEMTLFVDKVSGLRPRTIKTYRQHYLKWVDPVLGNKDIRYLKKSDYEKVFRAQEKAGRKQSSHNIPLIALNWIQKKIAGLGYMDIDALPKKKWRPIKSKNVYLTKGEVKGLLVAAKNHPTIKLRWMASFIATQFYLCCRVSEVCALQWDDIDWDNETIQINKNIGPEGLEMTTKNGKIHTAYPIHPELMPYLKAQKMRTGKCKFIFQKPYYYTTWKGAVHYNQGELGPIMGPRVINRTLLDLSKDAGIEKKITSHTLRKSACDIALRDGATIHQVAYMSRTTPKNVLQSYSHLDQEIFKAKMASIKILEKDNEKPTEIEGEDFLQGKKQ